MRQLLLTNFIAVGCIIYITAVAAARPLHYSQSAADMARRLQAADFVIKPLEHVNAAVITNPLKKMGQDLSELANRMPGLPAAVSAVPSPLKPFSALASVLDKVEATLPNFENSNGSSGLAAPEPPGSQKQLPSFAISPGLIQSAAELLVSKDADTITPQESVSAATGMAFNGGKASAKAKANAQTAGSSAALASAVAIADHTTAARAQAASDASNPANKGFSIAKASITAVGDKSSAVVSQGGSLSVGLGGQLTAAETVSQGAATRGSIAYVGGTAVSSAGPGSTSNTTSYSAAAGDNNAVAATRADSISLGFLKGSEAKGSATANSQAANKGIAASQSLMESFAIVNGKTEATSKADAVAVQPGTSLVRDKAVGIGIKAADAVTHTESVGGSGKLGLAVIDSVVRSITAGDQKACADAVTKTYADLGSGAQIDLGTFVLVLKQRADNACVSSFKDHAGAKLAEQQVQLPSFDLISEDVSKNTVEALEAANNAVKSVHEMVVAPFQQVAELVQKATWGAIIGRQKA